MAMIPDRLKQARIARGFSQRELSRRCEIGEQQVWRYEREETNPPSDIDYLLGLTDNPQTQSADRLTPEQQRLLNAYSLGDAVTLMEMITERIKQNQKTS
jgi:transcriptional regulator with XRE-family HTH domain